MKLTRNGIKAQEAWEKAGIRLPGYDVEKVSEKAMSSDEAQWNRLKEIFTSPSLQMVSFTITEKGYALHKADGSWFPFVEADIKNGPAQSAGAMAVVTAMLYERYQAGKYPLALVSMDNCSQNGAKLRESVMTMAEEWKKAGFVEQGFVGYVSDENVVAFPWTMFDKITPRPSEQIAKDLASTWLTVRP